MSISKRCTCTRINKADILLPGVEETIAHIKAHIPVMVIQRASWFIADITPLSASQPLNILAGISAQPAAVNNVAISFLLTPGIITKINITHNTYT